MYGGKTTPTPPVYASVDRGAVREAYVFPHGMDVNNPPESVFVYPLPDNWECADRFTRWFVYALAIVMGAVFLYRLIELGDVCCYPFFKYLTNISWTLQFIFYALLALFINNPRAWRIIIFCGYFPVLGNALLVFVLVNVVFAYSSNLLEANIKEYDAGVVILVHTAEHILTFIAAFVVGVGFSRRIQEAHMWFWDRLRGWFSKTLVVLYQAYAILILPLLYMLVEKTETVYKVDIPVWIGVLVSVATLTPLAFTYIAVVSRVGTLCYTRRKE